jgi:hypothetical protein
MAKVDIEIVEAALKLEDLDSQKRSQIMNRIKSESYAIKSDKEKEPTVKKQFVIVVNDPYGKIAETGMDFSGWVVQIPEDDAPKTAIAKINQAASDFNLTPKGRKMPLKTVADFFEFGSPKINKESKLWAKTKEPVLVCLTNGKIEKSYGDTADA